jgi:hypothetical protein
LHSDADVIAFYFDQHVPSAIVRGLRLRRVDIITAFEDGRWADDDTNLLEHATAAGRVLVTQDEDFLRIAALWIADGREFAGIVYAHQMRIGVGRFIADLELIAKSCDPAQFRNHVEHLPL